MPELVRELNPLKDYQAVRKLKHLFRERKFDVVHTHSSKAGVVGRIAAWQAKVPVVVHTVHGQAFHRYEKPWKNAIYILSEKYAAARCHRIYAVAQAMIDQCVEAGVAPRDKYQVVYLTNGQAYFGKLQNIHGDFLVMKSAYIPQSVNNSDTSAAESSQTTLLRVTDQLYGPEDSIAIKSSQVAFWQNLRDDSKVTQAIKSKE